MTSAAATGPTEMPLGRSIGRAHKFVRAWGDRQLEELGSSVTEWIVLFHIDAAEAPGASQSEIARYSEMGPPALVRHIDRLEADGIVTRTRDADDRRVIRLALTPAGDARLEEVRVVMADCDAQLRSLMTAAEADAVQLVLDRVFAYCRQELLDDEVADLPGDPPTTGPDPTTARSPR